GRAMWRGTLAHDEIEGQDAALLGRFAAFCDVLFGLMRRLEEPRTVDEHAAILAEALEALIAESPETAADHRLLRDTIGAIVASAERAGFDRRIGLGVMRALIEERVDRLEPARGFLAGGVTFCAMVPMRNI